VKLWLSSRLLLESWKEGTKVLILSLECKENSRHFFQQGKSRLYWVHFCLVQWSGSARETLI